MKHGVAWGQIACIALTSCAGFALGGCAGPFLFAFADLSLRWTPHELPFAWVEPMKWTALACAVLGAGAGGILAWFRLRTSGRGRRRAGTPT